MNGNLIYPQGPMVIVDRGMRNKLGSGPGKSSINEKDIRISVFKQGRSGPAARSAGQPSQSTTQAKRPADIRFVVAKINEPKRTHREIVLSPSSKSTSKLRPNPPRTTISRHRKRRPASTDEATDAWTSSLELRGLLPTGSGSPFYAIDDGISYESVKLLSTCMTVHEAVVPTSNDFLDLSLSSTQYPLQSILPLTFDPIPLIFAEGVTDGCSLTAFIFRLYACKNVRHSTRGRVLYHQSISRLRRCVTSGLIQDHTICAASELAFAAYQNNLDESDAHLEGTLRLIEVRGGLISVARLIQTKILGILLKPAVDMIAPQYLPDWTRKRPTIAEKLNCVLSQDSISKLETFVGNLHPSLFDGFKQLSQLSHAISYAIDQRRSVHPFSLDEDIMSIQYQMLSFVEIGLQECCRLAILVYTKTLSRAHPLEETASRKIATLIRAAHGSIAPNQRRGHGRADLYLWILVLGALVSQNTDYGRYFQDATISQMCSMGITTRAELLTALHQFVWIPRVLDPHLFALKLAIPID